MSESSRQNYEWHRERALRERVEPNKYSANRAEWNIRRIEEAHGKKAAHEITKEFNSKRRSKQKMYFT